MVASLNLATLILFLLGGQAGVPLGLPPGPEDPAMYQFAPEQCVAYSSWASTVAADPEGNATERWMATPAIQASYEKLKDAVREMAVSGSAENKAFGEMAFRLAEKCLNSACGFYLGEIEPVESSFRFHLGVLVNMGEEASQINDEITSLLAPMFRQNGLEVTTTEIDGTRFHRVVIRDAGEDLLHPVTWGVVNDQYLAVTVGEGEMKNLLDNLNTGEPEWLSDLRAEISVDRVSSTTWVDTAALFDMVRASAEQFGGGEDVDNALQLTGLDKLTTAGWIAGLDDQGFICRGSVHIDGEPTGIFGLFSEEALEPELFGKVADDRMVVTGMRLSVPKIFSIIRDINESNEWSRGNFDRGVDALNNMIDIDLEEDVIGNLDDYAYVYGSVNFANPTAGWVLGIGASNEMDLAETYEKINEYLKDATEDGNLFEVYEFQESTVNDTTVYGMKDKRGWGMPNFSWTMSDGELLISLDKSSIRRHLRRESMAGDALANDPWFAENAFTPPRMDAEGPLAVVSLDLSSILKIGLPLLTTFGDDLFHESFGYSLDDLPSVEVLTKDMKPNITSLYRTPEGFEIIQRQTYPGGTPGTVLATTVIGVMPASMQVRRAALRTEGANRMRQLVIALHNYHDTHRGFPSRYSKNADDEPLLSWRVHILPYLEEGDLYEEFHLDEPWDSEHNKALIERMPQCYFHPAAATEDGKTVFVVPAGEGSAMAEPDDDEERPVGMSLVDVTDGTSRTGVIFEANAENAVIWTKPDDFDWANIEDPVSALFDGWDGDGVNVALADGSVQFISREKLQEIIDKLIRVSDGEIVDWHDE